MILGIDFGTCFSLVAVKNNRNDNIVKTGHIQGCEHGVPTEFCLSSNGRELYGFDCRNEQNVVQYIKRTIRENPNQLRSQTIPSGGRKFSAEHILRGFLSSLIAQTKGWTVNDNDILAPGSVEAITITAPVGIASGLMTATDYNSLLKNTVRNITGLAENKVFVLEEPVAGAISYLQERDELNGDKTVLVFDLGGGTLDVSIVQYNSQNRSFVVCEKQGDPKLGGNDWDKALANIVLRKINKSAPTGQYVRGFNNKVNDLKHRLTVDDSSEFLMRWSDNSYASCDVSRTEFESATRNLLNRALTVVNSVKKSHNGKIDKIVLIGGASNMPQIRNMLVRNFGSEIGESNIISCDPSRAIARGASIYTKMVLDGAIRTGGIVNSASHTYGIKCKYSKQNGRTMINNLLFKGAEFNKDGEIVSEVGEYHPSEDDYRDFYFSVYESDSSNEWDELESGRHNGMEVKIDVPTKYYGKATKYDVSAKFRLSQDGILELIILDENGNRVGSTTKQL